MAFQPMPLSRKPQPFDHPEWVFELKYDGFRSLAVIHGGRCELISRNGHPFSFGSSAKKCLCRVQGRPYSMVRLFVWINAADRSSMTCSSIVASLASLPSIY